MIKQRLEHPAAARELFFALRDPSSRFVAMNSASSAQALSILRDLDRTKANLERNTAFDPERITFRHECERKLMELVNGMVELTADMAIAAGMRRDHLTDRLVQEAYRKKAGPAPAPIAEQAAAAV